MKRIGLFVGLLFLSNLATGQTSELVLTATNTTDAYVIQGGQIIRQFNRSSSSDGPAFAAQSTLKMFGVGSGNIGVGDYQR